MYMMQNRKYQVHILYVLIFNNITLDCVLKEVLKLRTERIKNDISPGSEAGDAL